MKMNEYQRLASRTIRKDLARAQQEEHGVYGLCAEAGEVASLYQKFYQGHPITEEHLVKELGDCLWMIAEICTANDIPLEYVATVNIEKLKARYPEGFTEERSVNRDENDI